MKNNSKRICALLLAVVMCVTCVVPVFAEIDGAQAPGYKCPEAGNEEKHSPLNCDCVEVEGEGKKLTANCIQDGFTTYKCLGCGIEFQYTEQSTSEECEKNVSVVVVTAPTCSKSGSSYKYCAEHDVKGVPYETTCVGYNNAKEWTTVVLSGEHGVSAEIKTQSKCKHCGELILGTIETISGAHAYKFEAFTVVPTCETDGVAKYVCTVDGCTASKLVAAPKGDDHHVWEKDKTNITDPTCLLDGKAHAVCSVCHIETNDYVVDKLGHDYGELIAEEPASCSAPGVKAHYICSRCNSYFDDEKVLIVDDEYVEGGEYDYTDELAIDMLDHTPVKVGESWYEWDETINSNQLYSCGKYEVYKQECDVCGTELDNFEGEAQAHGNLQKTRVEANCSQFGIEVQRCVTCGGKFEVTDKDDPTLSRKEHTNWSAWEYVAGKVANCTTAGVITRKCLDCADRLANGDINEIPADAVQTKDVAAFGHHYFDLQLGVLGDDATYIVVDPTKVSCEVDYPAVKMCYLCDLEEDVLMSAAEVKLHGHNWTVDEDGTPSNCITVNQEATCTRKGQETLTCPGCDRVETRLTDELPHVYDAYVSLGSKTATCQQDATYIMACDCGEEKELTATELDKIDHDLADYDITPAKKTDHKYIKDSTDPLYKAEKVDITQPNCKNNGDAKWQCAWCNHWSDPLTLDELDELGLLATDHNLGAMQSHLPTCADGKDGFKYQVCSNANCPLGKIEGAEGDHIYTEKDTNEDWVIKYTGDISDEHHTDPVLNPNTKYHNGKELTEEEIAAFVALDPDFKPNGLIRVASCTFAPVYDYYCNDCENYFSNHKGEAFGHDYEYVPADDKNCEKDVYDAHYKCKVDGCDAVFTAPNVTSETTLADLLVHAKGHYITDADIAAGDGKFVAANDPTCTLGGNYAYYQCLVCNKFFDADKNAATDKNEDGVIDAKDFDRADLDHNYGTLNQEVSATCEEYGVIAYYKCARCNAYFDADKNPITLLDKDEDNDGFDDALRLTEGFGHNYVTDSDATAINKYYDENGALVDYCDDSEGEFFYVACSKCDSEYITRKNFVYPFKHNIVDSEAIDATCPDADEVITGHEAGEQCAICDKWFTGAVINPAHKNEAGETLVAGDCNTENPATDRTCKYCEAEIPLHDIEKDKKIAPNCIRPGQIKDQCKNCTYFENVRHFGDKVECDKDALVWVPDPDASGLNPEKAQCEFCGTWYYRNETKGVKFDFDVSNKVALDKYLELVAAADKAEGDAKAELLALAEAYAGNVKVFVNGGKLVLRINYTAKDANFASLLLNIKYNSDVLEFVDGEFLCLDVKDEAGKPMFPAGAYEISATKDGNAVKIFAATEAGATPVNKMWNGEGAFVELYFDILSNVAPSTEDDLTDLCFVVDAESKVIDSDSTELNVVYGELVAEYATELIGNVHGNINLGVEDLNELLKIAFGETGNYSAVADVDQDGDVDLVDYSILRKTILKGYNNVWDYVASLED